MIWETRCSSPNAYRTLYVTVNSVPSQPGTISGSTSVCAGGGAQTYSISAVSGATIYTWNLPSGWTGSSTGTSISATPSSNAQSGNISVTANNGCGSSTSRTLSVTVNSAPSQPGAISGPTTVEGSGAISYSIQSVTSATGYTWSVPSGWTINSGQNTTSISATPTSSAQSGYIRVTANNTCGSGSEQTLYVTYKDIPPTPTPPGPISGSTSVCAGSGTQTYSISAVSGATGYTWSVPSGWIITNGQNTTGISATPGLNAQSGNIGVTANNSSGSSPASTVYVTVNFAPSQPGTISGPSSVEVGSGAKTYSISSVSGATSYAWSVPAGWTINSGQNTTSISATPTSSAQSGDISVRANNACGSSSARTLYITISAPCNGVVPLLTTKWNQGDPYNKEVVSKLKGNFPTGCGATAMAQIMYYWSQKGHKNQRTLKPIPAYKTESLGKDIVSITNTTTYDWDYMKNTTTEYTSDTQRNAVARLMYECGVALRMDYNYDGSSSLIGSKVGPIVAFPDYFNYDSKIYTIYRDCSESIYSDCYNGKNWDNKLREELDADRPIFYFGTGDDGGHFWVCDGYKCNGNGTLQFHFNWGWGGSGPDGYFETTLINPQNPNCREGNGTCDFKTDQRALINIIPNPPGYVPATGANGINTFAVTANASTGGYIIPSGTTYLYLGENQPYTFEANSGYEIDQVFIDGFPNADAKANGYYIFENVTANHSIIVTFKFPTGIKDPHSPNISIFPNPAKDEIFIKSDLPIKKVEMYSLTGTLLKQEINFNEKISVSALPQGVYLLKVYTDNGLVNKKVVKK